MSQSYIKNLSRSRLSQQVFGFTAIRTSNTVPLIALPAPHAGDLIIGIDAILEFRAATAYAGALVYTLAYSGGTTLAVFSSIATTANMYQYADLGILGGAPTDLTANVGLGLTLTAGANRATGTGTILFTLIYRLKRIGG